MRIRTIKPEFWTSESIGKLSRNARLLFIGLWSLADDSGRLRGALPYLSGQLFPYDSDATPANIAAWLAELCRLGMVRRYEVDGSGYLDIPKWLKHQKIEKPSKSRFPEFVEDSGNSRGIVGEASVTDLGPRTIGSRTLEGDLGAGPTDHGNGPSLAQVAQPELALTAPPTPVQPQAEPFDEFWQAYPRKVGKQAASRAFDAARKGGGTGAIVAAAKAFGASVAKWPKDRQEFVPHPATWLNQGRYDDDPAEWAKNEPRTLEQLAQETPTQW